VDNVALWQIFSEYLVSPASLHSTKFSILTIIRGRYTRPIRGRRLKWTQFGFYPPPPLCELKKWFLSPNNVMAIFLHSIFFLSWGDTPLGMQPLFGLLYQPQMIHDDCGVIAGMRIDGEDRSTPKTCPSATSFTFNAT
jgi:hypothetical protein